MEELGIARGVKFGLRDVGKPVLWFGVDTLNGGALQVFNLERAAQIITAAGCYDINGLEGRACVVETDRTTARFLRWHKEGKP